MTRTRRGPSPCPGCSEDDDGRGLRRGVTAVESVEESVVAVDAGVFAGAERPCATRGGPWQAVRGCAGCGGSSRWGCGRGGRRLSPKCRIPSVVMSQHQGRCAIASDLRVGGSIARPGPPIRPSVRVIIESVSGFFQSFQPQKPGGFTPYESGPAAMDRALLSEQPPRDRTGRTELCSPDGSAQQGHIAHRCERWSGDRALLSRTPPRKPERLRRSAPRDPAG